MPGLLHDAPATDAQRRSHDIHRPIVVLAVLGVLALHVYLFTPASILLGIPPPRALLAPLIAQPDLVFQESGLVETPLTFSLTERTEADSSEPLIFYATVLGAFLSAYFLPLAYKRPSLVIWSAGAIIALYGARGAAGLFAAHIAVYLTLHPRTRGVPALSFLPGILGYLAFARLSLGTVSGLILLACAAGASALLYRYLLLSLLRIPRLAGPVRTVVIQSALITVCAAALVEGQTGRVWAVPLGLLMFFWHWERVMMYHIDYKDGLVPEDISLWRYLAIFVTPGGIPVWHWGVTIGQGYAYTDGNFLCEDKNKTVRSGAKLLLVAVAYLISWRWGREILVRSFALAGVDTFDGSVPNMLESFSGGVTPVSTVSVLATTMVELIYWTLAWGGVVHLKVGLWRICGYRTDPYFNKPWLSTNLVVLWTRFTFHYREFLVRAFYYPVFFRFFRQSKALRIVAATMAAATAGNLIWGHLPEKMYYGGARFSNFFETLRTWPYYVLLGVGISLTELYLLKRTQRRRKPWTWGPRIGLDVLAAYCTLQFYAMIHIFSHPTESSTVSSSFRLFFRGLGLHF